MGRIGLRTTLGTPLFRYATKPLDFPADVWLHPDELKAYKNPMNPSLDPGKVRRLTEEIPENGVFRPVSVISDGQRALMDDGHHRTEAASQLGMDKVPTEIFRVRPGFFDEEDAAVPLGPGLASWWKGKVAASPGLARYIILPQDNPEECLRILHGHGRQLIARVGADDSPEGLFQRLQGGGFTLHDHTGNVPKSGYMVSMYGREQPRPLAEMTPQHIADYQQQHAEDLSQPGNHLGAWLASHGGQPYGYLDVSRHYPQITPAIESAARNAQLGIYDLGAGVSMMPSGGTWLQGGIPAAARRTSRAATGSSGSTWYSAPVMVPSLPDRYSHWDEGPWYSSAWDEDLDEDDEEEALPHPGLRRMLQEMEQRQREDPEGKYF